MGPLRNLLKRVAHHRQMTWPGHQQACLSLPFLSHQSFATSVDRWLRGTVLRFRPILVPFHLPSTRVRDNSPVRICCTMCPVGISSCCSMEKLIFHASVRLCSCRPGALLMDILQRALRCRVRFIRIWGTWDNAVQTLLSFRLEPSFLLMRERGLRSGDASIVCLL